MLAWTVKSFGAKKTYNSSNRMARVPRKAQASASETLAKVSSLFLPLRGWGRSHITSLEPGSLVPRQESGKRRGVGCVANNTPFWCKFTFQVRDVGLRKLWCLGRVPTGVCAGKSCCMLLWSVQQLGYSVTFIHILLGKPRLRVCFYRLEK